MQLSYCFFDVADHALINHYHNEFHFGYVILIFIARFTSNYNINMW